MTQLEAAKDEILVPGSTCWRRERAERLAFMVDGEAYFAAVASAFENARRSLWLLGWDFHSGVQLRRSAEEPTRGLVELLDELVRRSPELHVHVLGWDYAMLYSLERQFLPPRRWVRAPNRRRGRNWRSREYSMA